MRILQNDTQNTHSGIERVPMKWYNSKQRNAVWFYSVLFKYISFRMVCQPLDMQNKVAECFNPGSEWDVLWSYNSDGVLFPARFR